MIFCKKKEFLDIFFYIIYRKGRAEGEKEGKKEGEKAKRERGFFAKKRKMKKFKKKSKKNKKN